jgi:hypothetical protein
MKKIIRLTESDLTRIVRRVIMEQASATYNPEEFQKLVANVKATNFGTVRLTGGDEVSNIKGTTILPNRNSWIISTTGKKTNYEGKVQIYHFGLFCNTGEVKYSARANVFSGSDNVLADYNKERLITNWKDLCPPFEPQARTKRVIDNTNKTGFVTIKGKAIPVQAEGENVFVNYDNQEYAFDCGTTNAGRSFYQIGQYGEHNPVTPAFYDISVYNGLKQRCNK